MNRAVVTFVIMAFMLLSVSAFAQMKDMPMKGMEKGSAMTISGEIVDMGCFTAMGARGADHKSCAAKCISEGMPMGLLTSDGKLYLLTLNHDNADPYNSAKTMASQTVTVTGSVSEKDGIKSLEVTSIKLASK